MLVRTPIAKTHPQHASLAPRRGIVFTIMLGFFLILFNDPVHAISRCKAVAGVEPHIRFASLPGGMLDRSRLSPRAGLNFAQAVKPITPYQPKSVSIRFVTHSTFLITTAEGVTIATDYAGFSGPVKIPTVVTMNHAHETHWTAYPDPKINHVLKGWGENGKPARHELKVKDVKIRNVTTNIRNWAGGTDDNGNSIFIFEVANLCIGHLGHLHHTLNDKHLSQIGQLDIVMVPVDGSFTLDTDGMLEVVKKLKARVVLPMHWFSGFGLDAFLSRAAKSFAVQRSPSQEFSVSTKTLPPKPTVIVLGQDQRAPGWDD